jgi:hypothetical protein
MPPRKLDDRKMRLRMGRTAFERCDILLSPRAACLQAGHVNPWSRRVRVRSQD